MKSSSAAPRNGRARALVLATLRSTLSAAVIAYVAACSDNGQASSITSPTPVSPRSDVTGQTTNAGHVIACVSAASPAGAYTFSATEVTWHRDGDVVSSPATVNHTAGNTQCVTLFTRPSGSLVDLQASIEIAQVGPAGQSLSINCTPDSPELRTLCSDAVTASANVYHGTVVTYSYATLSKAAINARCVWSSGWYANQGAAAVNAKGLFFYTGLTWTYVLSSTAKTDPYFILSRQYIAARLNVDAGGSPPANVQAAMAGAVGFFVANPLGTPDGYNKTTLTDWATLLESFNTGGVKGWPHCG